MNSQGGARERTRTRLPADQRRAQLLAEAARLFVERGYAGVGIDEIGAAAGISGPAVYRHVSGKEQLVVEITSGWMDLVLARIPAPTPEQSPAEHAATVIRSLIETAWNNLPELTVSLRYAQFPLSEGAAARTPVRGYPHGSSAPRVDERFEKLAQHWIPAAQTINPDMAPEQSLIYLRAGAGLLLGAAAAERDMPQNTRFALLTDAELRLLRAPANFVPAHFHPEIEAPTWVRANRREQILDTAVRMFRRRGYSGVSMADIATAVGVTASASYRHFASKEALLATAVERASDRYILGASAALASATDGRSALNALIHAFVRDTMTDTDLAVVHATERYHLCAKERSEVSRRDHLLVEEWSLALSRVRPELNVASREMLILGAMRLVVEVVCTHDATHQSSMMSGLVAMCEAVLGITRQSVRDSNSETGSDLIRELESYEHTPRRSTPASADPRRFGLVGAEALITDHDRSVAPDSST